MSFTTFINNLFIGTKQKSIKRETLPAATLVEQEEQIDSIHRLVEIVGHPKGLGYTGVNKWLNEIEVNNIQKLVSYLTPKNIQERKSKLINKFGPRVGDLCSMLELKVAIKIKEGLTPKEFWYVCSIPNINWIRTRKLENISPGSFHSTKSDLPAEILVTLTEHQSKWTRLNEVLTVKESTL